MEAQNDLWFGDAWGRLEVEDGGGCLCRCLWEGSKPASGSGLSGGNKGGRRRIDAGA